MLEIQLERFLYGDSETLGRLRYPGGLCFTLEDPWLGNQHNISCIPEGSYGLALGMFKGLYQNFHVLDVPDRSAIEIHRGNTSHDTHGCILLGKQLTLSSRGSQLLDSKSALDFLMSVVKEEARLTVGHYVPPAMEKK
jgi:hypothetical protein